MARKGYHCTPRECADMLSTFDHLKGLSLEKKVELFEFKGHRITFTEDNGRPVWFSSKIINEMDVETYKKYCYFFFFISVEHFWKVTVIIPKWYDTENK